MVVTRIKKYFNIQCTWRQYWLYQHLPWYETVHCQRSLPGSCETRGSCSPLTTASFLETSWSASWPSPSQVWRIFCLSYLLLEQGWLHFPESWHSGILLPFLHQCWGLVYSQEPKTSLSIRNENQQLAKNVVLSTFNSVLCILWWCVAKS